VNTNCSCISFHMHKRTWWSLQYVLTIPLHTKTNSSCWWSSCHCCCHCCYTYVAVDGNIADVVVTAVIAVDGNIDVVVVVAAVILVDGDIAVVVVSAVIVVLDGDMVVAVLEAAVSGSWSRCSLMPVVGAQSNELKLPNHEKFVGILIHEFFKLLFYS
jgi:hypothetical protein